MKKISIFFVLLLFVCGAAFAGGLPSSKATADVSTLVKCTMSKDQVGDDLALPESCVEMFSGTPVGAEGPWIPIMSKPMKLSNSQSLFVSPSLVSGLYTLTRTKTSPKTETNDGISTAEAMGAVYMRAELVPEDGGAAIPAAPLDLCEAGILGCESLDGKWGVVLDSRIQTLSQQISECTVMVENPLGGEPLEGTCDFTSTIGLILKTASANTFNFIFPSVGQGVYTLNIYAAVGSDALIIEGNGSAVGAAAFGLGSVTAEAVRLVHDFEF